MKEPVQITVSQVFLILLFASCYINLQFPSMDLVKKSVLNTCVSNHGPVDGNGSIMARYLLYSTAIHYCIYPAIIIICVIEI